MTAFEAVHPCYRRRLQESATTVRHEGEAVAGSESTLVRATRDGIELSVVVQTRSRRIESAKHHGSQGVATRALLDRLCDLLLGMTVQEASDHAPVKLMHDLRDGDAARPVAGVVLPGNADPMFDLPTRLVRGLRESFAARSGDTSTVNFFESPPSPGWQAGSAADRKVRLAEVIGSFARGRDLAAAAIALVDLEPSILKHEIRVFVALSDAIPPGDKPALMRSLERHLKETLEPKLEVHLRPLKDRNVIRRL